MILHESPGSRFSLIPGDYLGKGSVKETIKLGEMKLLGISQQKKEFSVQRENGNCKDYDKNDSPAKCYIDQILRPAFENETDHVSKCNEKGNSKITRKYPLRGYFLGVLTHTTAWDRLERGEKRLRLGFAYHSSGLTGLLKLCPCGLKIKYIQLAWLCLAQ